MRPVAIVGGGQSGAQLALGLQARGYGVTLMTDRTPDEVRGGPVMSSQCMFDTALQTERELGLNDWESTAPAIEGISYTVTGDEHTPALTWAARLDSVAQSVDQRVKCADWMEQFQAAGGDLVHRAASVADLEDLARSHDLVVVSTGKGDLSRLFPRDAEKSPFDRPQRALALTYVTGMAPRADYSAVSFNVSPGVGEYFVFPALTTTGNCEIMVFEGIPGAAMDRWDDVHTPEDHLARSLEILRTYFPTEYARCHDVQLTDPGGVLRGRLTPTVRRAVGVLPSGANVLGMADAVVLNDPITGQGSNNAAKSAAFYLESIVAHRDREFSSDWMRRTFDNYWRGWAQWVVSWTNSVLVQPRPHVVGLMEAAVRAPGVAAALANGFDDPRTFYPWWFDAAEAERFLETKEAEERAPFQVRDFRNALGQYATGVTVVTTRAQDGRKVGMTANSFASVSLDPPMVLWCPGKTAPSTPDFAAATHFAINVLARDQHHLSRQFATPADDKFDGVALDEGTAGLPLIRDSLARFQCRTVQTYDAGDHVIFLGEIEQYDAAGGEPLVFHSGYYHVATRHPET